LRRRQCPPANQPLPGECRPHHLDIEEHRMPNEDMRDRSRRRLRAQPPQTWPTGVAEQRIQEATGSHPHY
jgi:hypothetical protein